MKNLHCLKTAGHAVSHLNTETTVLQVSQGCSLALWRHLLHVFISLCFLCLAVWIQIFTLIQIFKEM